MDFVALFHMLLNFVSLLRFTKTLGSLQGSGKETK